MNKKIYFEENEKVTFNAENPKASFFRTSFGLFSILLDSIESGDSTETEKRFNAIFYFVNEHPFVDGTKDKLWTFYFDAGDAHFLTNEQVNVSYLVGTYPRGIDEKADKILLFLARYVKTIDGIIYSDCFSKEPRILFPETENFNHNTSVMLSYLCELGYWSMTEYKITAAGWRRIDSLKTPSRSKTIFVASSFASEFDQTIQTIEQVVGKTGMKPCCMKTAQTNNYIMPEIFSQIKQSCAVVAEISSNNSGVYFETGFATALSIPVIVICRKDRFESTDVSVRPHFDIAQRSTIVYSDLADLSAKLFDRIKATLSP